jgi:ParB-like chromosome segregation protein Spo0J
MQSIVSIIAAKNESLEENRMIIEYKRLDELREYENNPRNNDNAVAAVAASIKEFGFKVPIVIDAAGVIIAGHTRAKAAAQLGLSSVPCIVADDLTEEQIRAFRLADNKTGELAGWDFDKLDAELELLAGMDMAAFGFTLDDEQTDAQKEREDLSDKVNAIYEVIVECVDEYEQEEVFTRLSGEGLQCRVLTL